MNALGRAIFDDDSSIERVNRVCRTGSGSRSLVPHPSNAEEQRAAAPRHAVTDGCPYANANGHHPGRLSPSTTPIGLTNAP